MSRITVTREIARLDAMSRERALTRGETIQLDRLIRTERAYGRMRAAGALARQPVGTPAAAQTAGAPIPELNSETARD